MKEDGLRRGVLIIVESGTGEPQLYHFRHNMRSIPRREKWIVDPYF